MRNPYRNPLLQKKPPIGEHVPPPDWPLRCQFAVETFRSLRLPPDWQVLELEMMLDDGEEA